MPLLVVVVCCLLLLSTTYAAVDMYDSDTRADELEELLESVDVDAPRGHTFVVFEFFAPWCGHCQKFASEYALSAEQKYEMQSAQNQLRFVAVNCDVKIPEDDITTSTKDKVGGERLKTLCKEQGVSSFPTIQLRRAGMPASTYNGDRDATHFVHWLKKKVAPLVTVIRQPQTPLENVFASDRMIVLLMPGHKKADRKAFDRLARSTNGQFVFATFGKAWLDGAYDRARHDILRVTKLVSLTSDEEDDASQVNVEEERAFLDDNAVVVVIRSYDERVVPFANVAEVSEAALQDLYIPLLSQYDQSLQGVHRPMVFLHVDPENETQKQNDIVDAVTAAAREFRKLGAPLYFAWLDQREWDGARSGLTDAHSFPAMTIEDPRANRQQRFAAPADLDLADTSQVVQFVQQFLNDELTPYRHSQPQAETCGADAVTEEARLDHAAGIHCFVLDTYESAVVEKSYDVDVFVFFHSTTCGTCQKMVPVWRAIAKKYADRSEDVIFAKADAWLNDFPPSLKMGGVPDLRYYRQGEPVELVTEDRSVDNISTFIDNKLAEKVPSSEKQEL